MPGLFSASAFKAPVAGFASAVPKCGACGLYKKCKKPKVSPKGKGRRRILIVTDAPAETDDDKKDLRTVRDAFARHGVELERDCVVTSALICRPPGNGTPEAKQVDFCRPNFLKAVRDADPAVIVPLGNAAVRAVIGPIWKDDPGPFGTWAGYAIPNHKPNAWICPTFPPWYLRRSETEPAGGMIRRRFDSHVEAAVSHASDGPPYPDGPPDYRAMVRGVLSPRDAAKEIDRITATGDPCSFDYETNMLKPDDRRSEIVCASICRKGEETVAFPWAGPVVPAFRRFLRSPAPKLGANIKFEERWSEAKAGTRVRGFKYKNGGWCGMQAAHVADHRPMVTSVKFQAYVRLGMPDYSSHIRPYLESDGPRIPNRIRELDMKDLLTYCGLDSLLEYLIDVDQAEQLRIERPW